MWFDGAPQLSWDSETTVDDFSFGFAAIAMAVDRCNAGWAFSGSFRSTTEGYLAVPTANAEVWAVKE